MTSEQTYDRLLPIINMMDKSVTCKSVTDNLDGTYTYLTSKTKWIMAGLYLIIAGTEYIVKDVVTDLSITVSTDTLVVPAALTFDAPTPIVKHGTMKVVARELNLLPTSDKILSFFSFQSETVKM